MENNTSQSTDNHNDLMEKEKKANGKKKRFMILGGVATVILVIVLSVWISSMGHETTDNAQLDAMITPVRAIVPGFITDVRFTDNQEVKKGDTLIMIDQKDYLAKLAQSEAALESSRAQLELAKTGALTADLNANASVYSSQAAKENIASAQARLNRDEKDMARIEKMLKDGAATQQQYETTKAEYETAKAQFEMLKKQYEASSSQAVGAQSQAEGQKSQIALSAAMVKQREAELQLAKTQLENTIIVAPFDGIISKKSVEEGQYIQPNSPICSAVDFKNLYVTANFKETQIEQMRAGQEVDIKVDAFPKVKIKGSLQSLGGATGAKFSLLPPDNATGNFVKITQRVPVRIAITEYPKEMTGLLIPGLSVVVDVMTK
ncbi:MAG: HlyD family secretion protein [Bacteroidetes bacterium]|nr:HlyD family secretion protein [Bacteroidota bacterium]